MSNPATIESAEGLLLAGDLAQARFEAELLADQANGQRASALHLLGLIDASEGLIDDSLARLEDALALAPANPSWWHNLGWTHAARSDWDSALLAFERGIALVPEDSLLLDGRARALLECGPPAEAIEVWRRARACPSRSKESSGTSAM